MQTKSRIKMVGQWDFWLWRGRGIRADKIDENGDIVGGSLLDRWRFHNDIATVGANSLLDVYFRNQSQITAWYAGLIDNASFSLLSGHHGG